MWYYTKHTVHRKSVSILKSGSIYHIHLLLFLFLWVSSYSIIWYVTSFHFKLFYGKLKCFDVVQIQRNCNLEWKYFKNLIKLMQFVAIRSDFQCLRYSICVIYQSIYDNFKPNIQNHISILPTNFVVGCLYL